MKKILLTLMASTSLIALEPPERPGEALTTSDKTEILIAIHQLMEKMSWELYNMQARLNNLYFMHDLQVESNEQLKEVAKGINTLVWYMEHPADEIKYTPKK